MYQAAASGGGYSGEISNKIASGGTNRAAFGAINFGSGTAGGTSAGDGGGSNLVVYLALALVALFIFKR